jgi:hypothetical protein
MATGYFRVYLWTGFAVVRPSGFDRLEILFDTIQNLFDRVGMID